MLVMEQIKRLTYNYNQVLVQGEISELFSSCSSKIRVIQAIIINKKIPMYWRDNFANLRAAR